MEHLFNVETAKRYGVNAAVMIRHFQFWIIKNKSNNRHFHDGRTWSYCSVKAFTGIFPYWSTRQVRVIIDKLVGEGVLLKGTYSPKGYDRTTWYAFADEEAFVKNDKWNCQKPQMHRSDPSNASAGTDQPITYPIPNELPDDSTDNTVRSNEEVLRLDLELAGKVKFFTEQITRILHPNKKEAVTFARIARHIVAECQAGRLDPGIFSDAVEWARAASASTARNKKGLFVAKVKEKTGFQGAGQLLTTKRRERSKL